MKLLPISHDGAAFAGRRPRLNDMRKTALGHAIGVAIATAAHDAPTAQLRNHGDAIDGQPVQGAVIPAQLLERACLRQLLTSSKGQRPHYSSAADVAAKRDLMCAISAIKTYWKHQVRALGPRAPEMAAW